MYIFLAQLGLVFAVLLSLFIPFGIFWLKRFNIIAFNKMLDNVILVQFIFVSFAFFALAYGYITSDYSLVNVYQNSHVAMPLIYKVTALWGNHEGSMMLWVLLLSLANLIANNHLIEGKQRAYFSSLQIVILASLIAYVVIRSNPFLTQFPIPKQGSGFNPLLQDVGLVIHPPILYVGYISTFIAFAYAIVALLTKELSASFIKYIHIWTLFSWSFLTLGVSLGSWWAYRELGWGGYWFWDPVENASILPWLTSTALIHSLYVTKKLNTNYRWTILLSILTFLLSIFTTFLVRSGIVTSVHSFANDLSRGAFILSLLVIYTVFALGVFALRAHNLQNLQEKNAFFSRAGGIKLANILWSVATLIILLSLVYPLVMEMSGGAQVTVGREFFEKSFIPVLLFTLLIMSISLPASWQVVLPLHYRHFIYSASFALLSLGGFIYLSNTMPSFVCILAFYAGSLLVIRMIFWFISRLSTSLSYKFYLIWLVHLACGLFAVNLAIIETNSVENLLTLEKEKKINFAGFDIYYKSNENIALDNYLAGKVLLYVEKDNAEITILTPQVRYYPVENTQTSESSIYHGIFYDLYAVINEITKDGVIAVKFYFKPLLTWLWVIMGIIFICGILLFINMRKKFNEKTS